MHCRPAGTHLQPPPENTTRVYAVCIYEIITVPLKWKKMGKIKKKLFCPFIMASFERPEQIADGHSFLVSVLSDSLTSLI